MKNVTKNAYIGCGDGIKEAGSVKIYFSFNTVIKCFYCFCTCLFIIFKIKQSANK